VTCWQPTGWVTMPPGWASPTSPTPPLSSSEKRSASAKARRFGNALKLSEAPHHKTLDQFDFAFQPGLGPAARSATSPRLEFVRAKSTWLCWNSGIGKNTRGRVGRSRPAKQACRSPSPPSTTWSASSAARIPTAEELGSRGNTH
jgi:hypothetical protein